jgi:hypothetical protein
LALANETIMDLSNRYETVNVDKDRIVHQYHKERETILNSLGSMRVNYKDNIQSDSHMEVINRSLREIKDENMTVQNLRNENERLLKTVEDHDQLKQDNYSYKLKIKDENMAVQNLMSENERLLKTVGDHDQLKQDNYSYKLKIKELKSSNKMGIIKKQLKALIKNKLDSHKSEVSYIKSSFQSELSILKSSSESLFNNLLLKTKEIIMNVQFEKENQMIKYKNKLMNQYDLKKNKNSSSNI